MHATQSIASYVEAVADMSEEEKEAVREEARAYNESIAQGIDFNLTEEEYAAYEKVLDITGDGIMGYIEIPSIDVRLPVYHGVDEAVLQIAIGHIPGSSLPIGGVNTHCLVSGHRGLPSAKLFSDLDQLDEGDIFTITVLDETITYQVDQIRIVLPEETEKLGIVEGMDYCTLITCTPYGINTHRILVRGTRIANLDGELGVVSEAVKFPVYLVGLAVGIPLLFLTLLISLIYYRLKRPKRSAEEILEHLKNAQEEENKAEDKNKTENHGAKESKPEDSRLE